VSLPALWGVVLAGGSGTRFWPLSTPTTPKQFLPLVTDKSLLEDTVERFAPLITAERTLVVTGAAYVDDVQRVARGIPRANILGEPRAAGTAAALTWAARVIAEREPDAIMCCVHADWAIADPATFRDSLLRAATVAHSQGALVTVGIVPARPDPGFGYIVPGEPIDDSARRVSSFSEKPTRERATELIAGGGLWNSGIFVWQAKRFLAEVRDRTPEINGCLAVDPSDAQAFFAAVRSPISVDVGVLERSRDVVVIPGDFGWDDVGTWGALRRVRPLDDAGNATNGDVVIRESRDNVVHAMDGTAILYGVDNLVVVVKNGLTVVTTTDRATDLKTLLETLDPALRNQS
jgi:mannose-1-phosphate guanylyltransferase